MATGDQARALSDKAQARSRRTRSLIVYVLCVGTWIVLGLTLPWEGIRFALRWTPLPIVALIGLIANSVSPGVVSDLLASLYSQPGAEYWFSWGEVVSAYVFPACLFLPTVVYGLRGGRRWLSVQYIAILVFGGPWWALVVAMFLAGW